MPKSTMPRTRMKDNSAIDEMAKAYGSMLPKEFGGALNLFAHPVASAAVMSAIGFGVASHAFGLWMGTVAGAAEASRRVFETGAEAEQPVAAPPPKRPEKPRLELVSSNGGAEQAPASKRPAAGNTKAVATKVAAKPRKRADASSEGAAKVADTVAKLIEAAVDPVTTTTSPSKPKSMAKPDVVDDLKAISGVGPKLEQVLNKFGIWTYAQIAALDAAEIAWLDDELGFSGRIGRDDWTGQARKLVSGQ